MDLSNIDFILNMDAAYIGLFAAISMTLMQVLKSLWSKFANYSVALTLWISMVLAILVVPFSGDWRMDTLSIIVLGFIIASSASGAYSWAKKAKTVIKLSDFSDDK